MEVERYKENLWFNSIYLNIISLMKFTYVQQGNYNETRTVRKEVFHGIIKND